MWHADLKKIDRPYIMGVRRGVLKIDLTLTVATVGSSWYGAAAIWTTGSAAVLAGVSSAAKQTAAETDNNTT